MLLKFTLKDGYYQPSTLARKFNLKLSTLQNYLKDDDFFIPILRTDVGHRIYGEETVKKLAVFLELKKLPFRKREKDWKKFINEEDLDSLFNMCNNSGKSLKKYIVENNKY